MKRTSWFVLATALVFALAVSAVAQELPLTEKAAQKSIRAQDKQLTAAEKAQQRGDDAAVERNLNEFATRARTLQQRVESGRVDEEDALDVAERVDQATLKHVAVLEGIFARFQCGTPEAHQGCRGIERALEVSRRGHDTATQAVLKHAEVSLGDESLNKRSTRRALERNEALLRHAERAERRGDSATLGRAAEQLARNTEEINRAIENGQVNPDDAVSVLERVDTATSKHTAVLEGLLERVPDQARPAIERAIEKSRHGNMAATEALARNRAGDVQAGRPADAGARGGTSGRGASGPPSSRPGPPGGRPSGRPPRP